MVIDQLVLHYENDDGLFIEVNNGYTYSDEGRRQLRSATSRTCVVRRTYSNYGDRCFAELLQADISFQRFKWLLKTFFFLCLDRGAL